MMRGTKRFSGSDSSSVLNDSVFQGKRVFAGLQTGSSRPESSPGQQQQASTLCLDMQRAELSRQHVRALNTQFASWVQSQLQNHPDELWKDGAQDYLNHASNIMEKFADVVNWLKANVANGESDKICGSDKKNIETDNKESNKSGTVLPSLTGTTGNSWSFGGQNNILSNSKALDKPSSDTSGNALGRATTINESNKSGIALPSTTGTFGASWGSGGPKSSESKQIGNNLSSDKANNTPASTTASFGGTIPNFGGTVSENNKSGSALSSTTGIFGGSWGSGGPKSSESKQIGNNLSSDKANNSPAITTASFGSTTPNFGGTVNENNKSGSALPSTTGIFEGSWGSGGPKSSESKQIGNNLSSDKVNNTPASSIASFGGTTPNFGVTINENNESGGALSSTTGIFGGSLGSGGPKSSESKQIGNNLSSDKANNTPASTTASFGGTTPIFGGTTPSFGGTTPSFGGTAPSFGRSYSSGTSFSNNSPFSFGIQTSVANSQNSMPTTNNAANEEEDGEDAAEQPGSPSVKKTEEKGIKVVHEVKCKLYVKSTDPGNAWKDKGTGQLSIRCKDGITKGTKESKPTIIVRNDVGKLVLNALLYPGIKTNLQKNAVVAIFHSSGDGDDDSSSVVGRTFLLRTKSGEDRDKLDAAIKEYAPTA